MADHGRYPAAAARRSCRRALRRAPGGPRLLRPGDHPAADVRRPGGDRDRERPAGHGAAGEQQRSRALEQQTATGEVLASSASPRPTCSPCSTPSPRAPPACAGPTDARSAASRATPAVPEAPGHERGGLAALESATGGDSDPLGRADPHLSAGRSWPASGAPPRARYGGRGEEFPAATRSTRRRGPRQMARRCSAGGSHRGIAAACSAIVRAVHRPADRAAGDLRRPGRDRHREHPPVHRTAGPATGAADTAPPTSQGAIARAGDHRLLGGPYSRCWTQSQPVLPGCAGPRR